MSQHQLHRRDFLKAGSIAAVGIAFAGLVPERLFAAGADGAVLSIGFAQLPAEGASVRLAAAELSLSGDPTFISRGARVTVSSYHRAAKYDGKAGGHSLAAIFPALGYDPARYPRFNAWSFSGQGATDSGRRTVRFKVPVTATQGLQLAVLQEGAKAETILALTFGSRSDVLKLQPGVYVIALRESPSESLPNWGAQTLRTVGGELAVDTTAFSYIVVTVDYAS
jgi:hypothetical protein